MGNASGRPGEKHRFLLELWLEPREMVTRILRLRGGIKELNPGEPPKDARERSVASLQDVDDFIHEAFEADGCGRVGWEMDP